MDHASHLGHVFQLCTHGLVVNAFVSTVDISMQPVVVFIVIVDVLLHPCIRLSPLCIMHFLYVNAYGYSV